jgi:hypothetical protein
MAGSEEKRDLGAPLKGPYVFDTEEAAIDRMESLNVGKTGTQRRYHVWEVSFGDKRLWALSDNGKQKACGFAVLHWGLVTVKKVKKPVPPEQATLIKEVAQVDEDEARLIRKFIAGIRKKKRGTQ